jgi:hypothetical protein
VTQAPPMSGGAAPGLGAQQAAAGSTSAAI